jgi:hypothetical protein
MKKELVKEFRIDEEEKSLKKVKRYLSSVKAKFSEKYFEELKKNQNSIRRFTPVITCDAYNVLDVDPIGIAMKKIKENSVVMMEIRYDEGVIGKVVARKRGEKVTLHLEYEGEKSIIRPLLTIF